MLFLEPMLTMVISHCENCGLDACVLRSRLLKAEQNRPERKQPQEKKNRVNGLIISIRDVRPLS